MLQDASFTLRELCQTLGLSRSGYYAHRHKASRPRRQEDHQLSLQITAAFEKSRRTYGTPRLLHVLRSAGQRVGRRRIARIMRQQGLRPQQKSRFIPRTTQSDPTRRAAPNALLHQAPPQRPNQVWVTDITYLPTKEGWLYLSAQMDLYSRRIVGWAVADHLESSLVLLSLQRALNARPLRDDHLLHHSDQGCQYTSRAFSDFLQRHQIQPSMSRRGNCYDNAAMESFWATLKTECFRSIIPPTHAQAKSMLFDYIETFYNPIRLHSSLQYQSPANFEKLSSSN
jgi:putative transposase